MKKKQIKTSDDFFNKTKVITKKKLSNLQKLLKKDGYKPIKIGR